MESFDLGIAWNREPDNEFVESLHNKALDEGLKPYLLHAYNFYSSLKSIADGSLNFRFFLNRVDESDNTFHGLTNFLTRKKITVINSPKMVERSEDKFLMHSEFKKNKIPVPVTFFIHPGDSGRILEDKTRNLPRPFILKPAHGSSSGATVLAGTMDDILELRRRRGNIALMAQERVCPADFKNKPAWFKVFYCKGKIACCLWNPAGNNYYKLKREEIEGGEPVLSRLGQVTGLVASVCKLDLFATEIVMNDKGDFFVVDYADSCPNIRRQSKFYDGIPDETVDGIIGDLIMFVKSLC